MNTPVENAEERITRYKAGERDFSGANLVGARLRGANLVEANLDGANLDGANLFEANLDGANLRGANLRGAILRGANLDGANLRGARLTWRTNLNEWAFQGTVWPTDPAKLEGATIDGVPFLEFMETLKAIGPNPSPEVRAVWDVMQKAKADKQASQAASLNGPSPNASK